MERKIFFTALAVTMLLGTLLRRKKYQFSTSQAVIIAFILLFGGIGGTYLMGALEAGTWGNISYYGSVFIVPILMIPFSKIIKQNYSVLMDYCAPCGIAAIAVGKLNCKITGCCGGRVLWYTAEGQGVVFPSQLVEMAVATVILIILLRIEQKKLFSGKLYPYFLILYGSTRFVLTWFRETELVFGIMPSACFLSLIAVVLGIVWLLLLKKGIINAPVERNKSKKNKKLKKQKRDSL